MNATANVRASVWERALPWGLPALLLLGLVIRLVFIGSEGFRTDVSTFQAWALSAAEHGLGSFYTSGGFADYPPGYIYVLAAIGDLYNAVFRAHDAAFGMLRVLVKLPAVFADLGIGWVIYLLGCRFTRKDLAFGAAAFYVLNPVTIFVSAVYGQVDAFAGFFALLAGYFLVRAHDDDDRSRWYTIAAWVALSYSLLVKPQAAVLVPLFIAFAAFDLRKRGVATVIGIVAAVVFAVVLSEPFHPSVNPFETLRWLIERYAFGSSVYDYNSVNAFNLWAVHGKMWVKDSEPIFFVRTSLWGMGLLVAALALTVWRYAAARTPRAFLEAAAIALVAFFMLSTRMHERYIFSGLMFAMAAVPLARRYFIASIALSIVLFANLHYTLQYLNVMSAPNDFPGINAQNLWGWPVTVLSLIGLAAFFYLGYGFLGESDVAQAGAAEALPETKRSAAKTPASGESVWDDAVGRLLRARSWFDPREGVYALTKPLDYLVMGAFGVFNFVLSFVGYWYPGEKIFDEIYFARAGEEYLNHQYIYESTHPPLSKLLVTLSMMLFGGMPAGHGLGGWTGLNGLIGHMTSGDNAYGWRFLNVVFGAIAVMVLYAFAKRITGSTLFAAITAALLTFDGMHFVQSRLATPEGLVVVFSTLAVYAFYRFWIASQTATRVYVAAGPLHLGAAAAVSLALGVLIEVALSAIYRFDVPTSIVVALYLACGAYLLARYVVLPRFFASGKTELSFPEGSYALAGDGSTTMYTVDGGTIEGKTLRKGALTAPRAGRLVNDSGDATISYDNASVTYAAGGAAATADGSALVTDAGREQAKSARLWLIVFTIALGLLVSSKWYGVMGFGVSFITVFCVWLQRWVTNEFRRPALYGNPRGFRLDGVLVAIVFIAATVYTLVWVPDMIRKAPGDVQGLNTVVKRQYDMFQYHDTLVATHPYSSKWWEWPIDYVPIAYYYHDDRPQMADSVAHDNAHGVREVTSLPNPFVMWFGLLAVPLVGFLAWRERNKGYALIVLTYLMQWLPWMRSPRITFAYHFYVDIPLICLCNAIVLQKLWQWASAQSAPGVRWSGRGAVLAYVALVAGAFVFFYPVLTAADMTWNEWHMRMWIDKWIVGPG